MKRFLLSLFISLAAFSGFAQCHISASWAMAPQNNNLYRVQFTNSTTLVTGAGKINTFYMNWGDATSGYVSPSGSTYHNYATPGVKHFTLLMIVLDSSLSTTTVYCTDTLQDSILVTATPCATSFTSVVTGNSATFTANTPAGSTGMTYSWNFGDATTGTGSPVTHSYASAGTYTVTLTAVKTGTGGCTYVNTETVAVTSGSPCTGKHASFTIAHNGMQLNFTNTSSSISGTTKTASWSFGDGNTSTSYSASNTYATPGLYAIKLVILWLDSSTPALVCSDSVTHYDSAYVSSATNHISGYIGEDSSASISQVDSPVYKVWLINFDSASNILSAIDSVTVYGANPYYTYYQFNAAPAGTYRVKAKMLNGPTSGTGWVPTYHVSSLMWNTATTFHHYGGNTTGKNIQMQVGTATSGPGFVGGNVSAGANKGTSNNGIEGLSVFLLDGNGNLVSGATTDANGDYSFSNLPPANYSVYPEQMNFATTASYVTVTSGSPTLTNVNFSRSLSQQTITPITTGIINVNNKDVEYAIYPNPAKDQITIQWSTNLSAKADIVITDVTGKKVFTKSVSTGNIAELNLSGLQKGLYFVTIISNNAQSTQKLMLQ